MVEEMRATARDLLDDEPPPRAPGTDDQLLELFKQRANALTRKKKRRSRLHRALSAICPQEASQAEVVWLAETDDRRGGTRAGQGIGPGRQATAGADTARVIRDSADRITSRSSMPDSPDC